MEREVKKETWKEKSIMEANDRNGLQCHRRREKRRWISKYFLLFDVVNTQSLSLSQGHRPVVTINVNII